MVEATELTYGIYDNWTKSWLLCKFTEATYLNAVEMCSDMNIKNNKKHRKDLDKKARRYAVKSREEVGKDDI